jgi:hypothetical protein
MPIVPLVRSLWRHLRHHEQVESELEEELRATFDLLVHEKMVAGLSLGQPQRAAALELRIEPIKERVRDERNGVRFERCLQDVRAR